MKAPPGGKFGGLLCLGAPFDFFWPIVFPSDESRLFFLLTGGEHPASPTSTRHGGSGAKSRSGSWGAHRHYNGTSHPPPLAVVSAPPQPATDKFWWKNFKRRLVFICERFCLFSRSVHGSLLSHQNLVPHTPPTHPSLAPSPSFPLLRSLALQETMDTSKSYNMEKVLRSNIMNSVSVVAFPP